MLQFFLAQIANVAGIIGGSATFIALPWLTLELTGSSAQSALVIAATAIPVLIVSPFQGALIDRFGRRRIAWLGEVACALTLILVPILHGIIGMTIPLLIFLSVLRAAVSPGAQTARKALVPDVAEVAKFSLDKANSIHESVFAGGFAVGPAVASVLIANINVYAVFWFAGAASVVSAIAALLIRVTERQEHDPEEDRGNAFVYAMQGIRTLFRLKTLGLVFAGFTLLAMVYVPTEMVVLPRYYRSINDPGTLGVLITTMAGCTMATTLLFAWLHKRVGYANLVRIAMIGVAAAMIPMSFLPTTWLMLAFGVIIGSVWGPITPLLNTVVQKLVVANLRGRVFALEMMMWNLSPVTSFIVVGISLDVFGVHPVYLTLALLMTAGAVLLSLAPRLRELSRLD